MSQISFFQRYSQEENHATNNTLLALRYLYEQSPRKLSALLKSLTETDFSVGPAFVSQDKGASSVLDGRISQEGWAIYVEAKRGGSLDHSQIKRHVSSIVSRGIRQSVLLGLTRDPISSQSLDACRKITSDEGISFIGVTFADLLLTLREQCAPYEADMSAMLDDYEEFLSASGLLPSSKTIVVKPCGQSFTENVNFRLYFERPEQSSMASHDFIGLYWQKAVRQIGVATKIVVGREQKDSFIPSTLERGQLSAEDKTRILDAIKACTYYPDLGQVEHRYYLFGEIFSTELRKLSKGGLWGKRVLRVVDLLPELPKGAAALDVKDVATRLLGRTFT